MNNAIRKRMTSDVQMIAIAQNNAVNTAEDSKSPQRPVPKLVAQGGNQHRQMRIDSASRGNNEIMKLMKASTGVTKNTSGIHSSK